jgi:hypothetical protein
VPAIFRSVLVGQHHGRAGLAVIAAVEEDFQFVPAQRALGANSDFERVATGEQPHGTDARHPEDVVPEAGEVLAFAGFDRALEQREHGACHREMPMREMLARNLDEAALRRVDEHAVGQRHAACVAEHHIRGCKRIVHGKNGSGSVTAAPG